MADIEDHLGVTIPQVDKKMKIALDEFDGKVVYGKKKVDKGKIFDILFLKTTLTCIFLSCQELAIWIIPRSWPRLWQSCKDWKWKPNWHSYKMSIEGFPRSLFKIVSFSTVDDQGFRLLETPKLIRYIGKLCTCIECNKLLILFNMG